MSDELAVGEVPTEQQRARLEAMRSIMSEMGWRWFLVEIEQEIANTQAALLTAKGEQLVGHLQGRFEALDLVLHFEDLVDNALSTLEEE